MFVKFCILQITYWCGFGAFGAYLIPYLTNQGFSSSSVGLTMAIYTLVAMLGQLLYGYSSDKIKSIKRIYQMNHVLVIICILGIFLTPKEGKPMMVCLLGFTQLPMPVLLDSWIIKYDHESPTTYGPIRSSGSFAFAIFSFFFGYVIEQMGFIAMPIFAIILFTISFITTMYTKEATVNVHRGSTPSLKTVFNNKSFVIILIVSLFLGLSAGTIMNMQSYIVYGVGAKEASIGICMSISAMAQVPVMIFYPRFGWISNIQKMIVAITLYVISFIFMYIASTVEWLYIGMLINGIGFGMFLPAIREFVGVHINKLVQTTSLSLIDASQNCFGSGIGIFIAGLVIKMYDVKLMILVCTIFSLLAMFFSLYLCKIYIVDSKKEKCI